MKYEGIDLISFRKQPEVSDKDLLHVVFQSALAITAAHRQGVFHSDVKPSNMLYKDGLLKLVGFDVLSKMDSEYLVNKCRLYMTSKILGWTQSYCPPEVLYYKPIQGQLPISPGKIDAYCWGISMLQFLLDWSDEELDRNTSLLKRSFEDSSKVLKEIMKLKIPGLKEKTSQSLLRLICKSIKFSPCTRLSMD